MADAHLPFAKVFAEHGRREFPGRDGVHRGWKAIRNLAHRSLAVRLGVAVVGLAVTLQFGCGAAYSGFMKAPLKRLEQGDYDGALARIEKPGGDTNKLLYRLERGIILHYQGAHAASDSEFDKAERLVDKHYTRSLSREIAALLTNDAIRAYSGEEYERALIHYYRAMNHWYLGNAEGALVECRKANHRLQEFARAADYELGYKNDAFLQYLTGLLYEAEGELNDAYVSYQDAVTGYAAYRESFGLRPPRSLATDLTKLARDLGYEDDVDRYVEQFRLRPEELAGTRGAEIIVLAESGFIARKRQRDIDLPILENDHVGHVWVASERVVHRYHHPRRYQNVEYWLRVSLPEYQPVRSQVQRVRLVAGDRAADGVLVEDLDAIAVKSFEQKEGSVLLRTVARALVKYAATKKAEEESSILGALVNIFGVGTEAADTRGWLSLPKSIWMLRLEVPPGTVDLDLEFLTEEGRVVDQHRFDGVELALERPVFLSHRSFR